jgi:hypothetical protein
VKSIAIIREFRTKQFRVIVDAIPEEEAPDLSWDETGETASKLESGEYVLFCARARVVHDTLGELAVDYLGECIYSSFSAFQDHRLCGAQTRKLRAEGSDAVCGSYFSDMIRSVCLSAREALAKTKNIRVRGVS